MGKISITLKGIALFIALLWSLSIPCVAEKKPTTPPDPIEIEGEFEDEREKSLINPVEAWTRGNELVIVFYADVPNVTISIVRANDVVARSIVSFCGFQAETFSLEGYANGTYTLVITTPQGTYLTGVFNIE